MPNRRFTRIIVVGLDGFEPEIAEPMLASGNLPHLARVASRGGYTRVQTTYPAQTPVAWSTFATGVNPGAHGIFDFVRRDPNTYLPDLGLNRFEQKNPFVPPRVVNLQRGRTIWDRLAGDGVPTTCLRCPCTYPPDSTCQKMLSGLGVPDLRGGFGTYTFYTSVPNQASREGEHLISVDHSVVQPVVTYLPGPLDRRTRSPHRLEMTIERRPATREVMVRVQGTKETLAVEQGQWSPWLQVRFKLGFLQSVVGIVRFYLVRLDPTFELYASPINFDPLEPVFPISFPPEYAGKLAESMGTYYTAGMIEDHNSFNNGRLDEAAFLDQCQQVWDERQRMMLLELERFKEGLFYCLYDTPDRVQHMFWRFREPNHPANREHRAAPEYREVIEEHYRIADAVVGRALEYVDDRTLLMVLSDHGFKSFQRGVNLNTWLHGQGLLAMKNGLRPGPDTADLLQFVDWSHTKAYAIGLTGIYLNLQGRERDGIVRAEDVDKLKRSIATKLSGLPDPARGATAIHGAVIREEVYRGPYLQEAPDLLVNYAPGYRTSWSTAMGGIAKDEFEDNTRRWSGDHIVDPAVVPGVLWMNHPFRRDARLLDLAPTILEALGAEPTPEMEGKSLWP
jgi:predicted AlkP superfamily phosphohydrolase/phosphomutase